MPATLANDSPLLLVLLNASSSSGPAALNASGGRPLENETAAANPSETYISRILPSVVAMAILFVLSAIGNVTVFLTLVTSRRRKTRISIIILHLTIADLFVTFIFIPTEIVWKLLQYWFVGNAACKIFAFLRAFGFYLSSMVLIVVSLDRYIAIIYPLRANSEFARRGHVMLMAAWAVSALCSLPQAFMFDTRPAPDSPDMEQCVTFGSDPFAVTVFTLFFLVTVYFIPLIIMVITYSRILSTIINKSDFRQNNNNAHGRCSPGPGSPPFPGSHSLSGSPQDPICSTAPGLMEARSSSPQQRRHAGRSSPLLQPSRRTGLNNSSSNNINPSGDFRSSHFNRARARTLRMTILIVLAFIFCWTPNVVMTLWFVLAPESAQAHVDPRLADVLFILTITNSVVNPYVYGSYASEMRSKCFQWFSLNPRRHMRENGSCVLSERPNFLLQGHQRLGLHSLGGRIHEERGLLRIQASRRNTDFAQCTQRSKRFVLKYRCRMGRAQRAAGAAGGADMFDSSILQAHSEILPGANASHPHQTANNNFNIELLGNNNLSENCSSSNSVSMASTSGPTSGTKKKRWLLKTMYSRAVKAVSNYSFSNSECANTQPTREINQPPRIPKSRSLIVRLPSWDDKAAPSSSRRVKAADDEDFSIFTASIKASARSPTLHLGRARNHQPVILGRGARAGACRWNRMKRCRTTSELRIDF